MLDKTARKPSADPVQEKLRQDKAVWNKQTSAFLTKVIQFKKLINGQPNAFYKTKSKITQPIPADPASILNALTNEFENIAHAGSAIVAEQLDYAKTHRTAPKKPVPQAPTQAPAAGVAAPDLAKQLAAWEVKYDLVAQGSDDLIVDASNPFSRFLARKLTRTRGTSEKIRLNRMRMDMLTSCAKARKALSKLQVEITKGSKASIMDSYKLMQHIWNEWAVVSRTFNNYKVRINKQPTEPMEELPNEESFSGEKETLPDQTPPQAAPVPPPLPDVTPEPAQPEPEETPEEPKPEELPKKPLEAAAQAFVKKWLGKKRHQFFPQSGTSSYRLDVFEMAKMARQDLNRIMNILEKGLDVDQMQPLMAQVNKNIVSIRQLLRNLHMMEKPEPNVGGW
jgi:hypothetical protein